MQNRKLYLIFLLFFSNCAPSFYRIENQTDFRVEIKASPDRVILNCGALHDAKDSYLFFISVLDEALTVTSLIQSNNLNKRDCERRQSEIGKILNNGYEIYLAGMGSLQSPRRVDPQKHYFSKLGTYQENGRTLQLRVVANEYGQCFDIYSGHEKPCPRSPFPIKKSTAFKK